MKRAFVSVLTAAALCLTTAVFPRAAAAEETRSYIDNSDVTPKLVADSQVTLEDSGGGLMSPDWVKTLVIAEITIARCTDEGTFASAVSVLDHYQEMGVNGIWVTPIFDTSLNTGGHYGNYGPDTVDPSLTGTDDYGQGWEVVKNFVNEAHKRNIRVFQDIVTWGVGTGAPLKEQKPAWFKGASSWGGWDFDWSNTELHSWFVDQCVRLITDVGFDGFRCDLEPGPTGYDMYREVREKALEQGRKIAIFSEMTGERLQPAFDFDQHPSESNMWGTADLYTEDYNIVSAIKNGYGLGTKYQEILDESGTARFYSFLTSCHDEPYSVKGNLVSFAYQSLLAPFIPIFFMGEEFDNTQFGNSTLFMTPLNLSLLEQQENRDFYERVKQIIRIRRLYPEIFNYFPTNHRDSNICEVEVVGLETLTGYARYMDGKGVLVIPNNNIQDTESAFTVRIPYEEMGLPKSSEYVVTNLVTGEEVARGDRISLYDFKAKVAPNDVAVFMVEPAAQAAAVSVQSSLQSGTVPTQMNAAAVVVNEAAARETAADVFLSGTSAPKGKPLSLQPLLLFIPVAAAAGGLTLAALRLVRRRQNKRKHAQTTES